MTTFDRHMLRTFGLSGAGAVMAWVSFLLLLQIRRLSGLIGPCVELFEVAAVLAWALPSVLSLALPLGVFVGALIAAGRLVNSGAWSGLDAMGVAPRRRMQVVFRVTLLLSAAGLWVEHELRPRSEAALARRVRALGVRKLHCEVVGGGAWHRGELSAFTQVRTSSAGHRLFLAAPGAQLVADRPHFQKDAVLATDAGTLLLEGATIRFSKSRLRWASPAGEPPPPLVGALGLELQARAAAGDVRAQRDYARRWLQPWAICILALLGVGLSARVGPGRERVLAAVGVVAIVSVYAIGRLGDAAIDAGLGSVWFWVALPQALAGATAWRLSAR